MLQYGYDTSCCKSCFLLLMSVFELWKSRRVLRLMYPAGSRPDIAARLVRLPAAQTHQLCAAQDARQDARTVIFTVPVFTLAGTGGKPGNESIQKDYAEPGRTEQEDYITGPELTRIDLNRPTDRQDVANVRDTVPGVTVQGLKFQIISKFVQLFSTRRSF